MATKHPGLFADLDKKSSDVLTKDFPDKLKVDIKTKSISGVNLDASLARNPDNSYFGSLYPKYKLGTRVPLTVGIQVDTRRALKIDATAEEIVPGLKAAAIAHADTESITLEGEYKHEYVTLAASVNVLSPKGNKVTASSVVGYDRFVLGLQAEFLYDKWHTINGLVSFKHSDFITAVFARANTHTSAHIVGLSYYQHFHPRAHIAAEASLDINKSSENPKLVVGGSYDFEASPTTVKGKIDSEGKVSLSYAHRLNNYARVVLGTNLNTNNFSASGNHTYGLTLSIND